MPNPWLTTQKPVGGQIERWRPLVKKYFGKHTDDLLTVMLCESQGRPDAIGDRHLAYKKNGIEYGASYGLLQIRYLPGRPNPEKLLDPEFNIKYGAEIFKAQGFRPWSCRRALAINK